MIKRNKNQLAIISKINKLQWPSNLLTSPQKKTTLYTNNSAKVLKFSHMPPMHTKENGKQMPCQD